MRVRRPRRAVRLRVVVPDTRVQRARFRCGHLRRRVAVAAGTRPRQQTRRR